jgi:hypothetical protein
VWKRITEFYEKHFILQFSFISAIIYKKKIVARNDEEKENLPMPMNQT